MSHTFLAALAYSVAFVILLTARFGAAARHQRTLYVASIPFLLAGVALVLSDTLS
jgi:hypothetical protein